MNVSGYTEFDTTEDFRPLAEEMALAVLENERQHRYKVVHPLFSFSLGKLVVSLNKLDAENSSVRRPANSADPVFIIKSKASRQASPDNQFRRVFVRLKKFFIWSHADESAKVGALPEVKS